MLDLNAAAEQPKLNLVPTQTQIPDDRVPTVATKYAVALGENSPGVPAISAQLQTQGDTGLRDTLSRQEGLALEQKRMEMVRDFVKSQNRPLNPQESSFFYGLSTQDLQQDPSTILEKVYSNKYLNAVVAHDPEDSVGAAASENAPVTNAMMSGFEELHTKVEIAHKLLDEVQSTRKAESTGDKVSDFIGTVLPLSNFRLKNLASQAPSTSFLPGDNILDQVSYLYTLPPEDFQKQAKAALDSIGNVSLREQFASALISFSDADIAGNNLQAATDIADVGGMVAGVAGRVVKGVGAAVKAVRNAEGIEKLNGVLKGAVQASKNRALDVAKTGEATGNFEVASKVGAIKKVAGADEIQDKVPSLVNPRKFFDGQSNLARNQVQEIADRAEARAATADRILSDIPLAERVPEDRLNLLIQQAHDDMMTELKPISHAILDVEERAPVAIEDTRVVAKGQAVNPDLLETTKNQLQKARDELANMKTNAFSKPALDAKRAEVNALEQQVSIAGRATSPRARTVPIPVTQKSTGVKYVVNPAEANPLTNTTSITYAIGTKNGGLFPNRGSAMKFAKTELGNWADTEIQQHGSGFFIELTKDVPDSLDNFKNLEIPLQERASEGLWKAVVHLASSTKPLLGREASANRLVVVHGSQEAFAAYKQIVEPIARLSNAERDELGTILALNRDDIDPVTRDRGRFYDTAFEFETAFRGKFSKLPTPGQVEAYNAFVQASDLDYMVRSAGWFRDKVRVGLERISIDTVHTPVGLKGKPLTDTDKLVAWDGEGKVVDALPGPNEPYTKILLLDGDNRTSFVVSNKQTSANRKIVDDKIKDGYKVIQVADANAVINGWENEHGIAFIVTKEYQRGRLSVVGPYRAGGHVVNKFDYYIKQPLIKRGTNNSYYVGDSTVMSAQNERVAARISDNMETARKLMLRGDPSLDRYVAENIPSVNSGKEFRNLFKDRKNIKGETVPGLDPEVPITWTRSGERTNQKLKLSDHVPNIQDTVDSPYNLLTQLNRSYAGERDAFNVPALVEEGNQIVSHDQGDLLDPFNTLKSSAKNMFDVRYKRDYILRSSDDWVLQFKNILKTPSEDALKDPLSVLYNPQYLEKADRTAVLNAEQARKAVLRFVGQLGPDQSALETVKSKIVQNLQEGKFGNTSLVENWLIPVVKDPGKFGRSLAFHLKLGMFNPVQLFVQAQTTANVLAISPRAGFKGISAYYPIRAALLNPNMFEHSVQTATKLGWKAEDFKEMLSSLVDSGWHRVGSDYGLIDQISDPQIFQSTVGKVLDSGTVFFQEGEKVNRLTGYATAYHEWRTANPNKVLDRAAQRGILNRADDLTGQMSAANNATWQKGLLSVPLQFFAYQARLTELYLGKTLDNASKARLFAMQSALYGLPVAAGGAVGVLPIYESVLNTLQTNHIPYDNTAVEAVLKGLPTAILKGLTGLDTEAGPRFGSPGATVLRDWWRGDKSVGELALGASGSSTGDLLASVAPAFLALGELLTSKPEDRVYRIDKDFMLGVMKNATTLNNVYKMYYAMNTGKWLSKNGQDIGDVTNAEAMFMGLTGVALSRIQSAYTGIEVLKDQKKIEDDTLKEVTKLMHQGFLEDDPIQRADYLKRAKALSVMGNLSYIDMQRAMKQAISGETMIDSVNRRMEEDAFKRGLD